MGRDPNWFKNGSDFDPAEVKQRNSRLPPDESGAIDSAATDNTHEEH